MTLPRVTPADAFEGVKMLKPSATARECRGTAFWSWGGGPDDDLGGRAFRRLLALDPEADAVLNARFESTAWSIGIYGRRCMTLTGDVVRVIRTVRLPMPGDHGDHSGHQER